MDKRDTGAFTKKLVSLKWIRDRITLYANQGNAMAQAQLHFTIYIASKTD